MTPVPTLKPVLSSKISRTFSRGNNSFHPINNSTKRVKSLCFSSSSSLFVPCSSSSTVSKINSLSLVSSSSSSSSPSSNKFLKFNQNPKNNFVKQPFSCSARRFDSSVASAVNPSIEILSILQQQQLEQQQPPRRLSEELTPVLGDKNAEIKNADMIFFPLIDSLAKEFNGREHLQFPREVIFLNGPPGCGKGSVASAIMKERGLTTPPVVCSDLLNTDEAIEMKKSGKMIGDKQVVELMLRTLLEFVKKKNKKKKLKSSKFFSNSKKYFTSGVVVDGFPRTEVQAKCCSLLFDLMVSLKREFPEANLARPCFRIVVLYIDEPTSIARQMKRGQMSRLHNAFVSESGIGDRVEERVTDMNEAASRNRYLFFKHNTYPALMTLRKHFPFHFIDASGTLQDVIRKVTAEMQYQSSLELSQETLDMINIVPLAGDLVSQSRQRLVSRLDSYATSPTLRSKFHQVIEIISREFMHIVMRQAMSGVARVRTENPLLLTDPIALEMMLDVLSERGFQVILDYERRMIPEHVDLTTGKITNRSQKTMHFEIRFPPPRIRSFMN